MEATRDSLSCGMCSCRVLSQVIADAEAQAPPRTTATMTTPVGLTESEAEQWNRGHGAAEDGDAKGVTDH